MKLLVTTEPNIHKFQIRIQKTVIKGDLGLWRLKLGWVSGAGLMFVCFFSISLPGLWKLSCLGSDSLVGSGHFLIPLAHDLLSVVLSQSCQEHALDRMPLTSARWVLEGIGRGKKKGWHGTIMTKAEAVLSEKPDWKETETGGVGDKTKDLGRLHLVM